MTDDLFGDAQQIIKQLSEERDKLTQERDGLRREVEHRGVVIKNFDDERSKVILERDRYKAIASKFAQALENAQMLWSGDDNEHAIVEAADEILKQWSDMEKSDEPESR